MFDGRQNKETLSRKIERERGNESVLVVKAVEQEEKDERIKKDRKKERTQCARNSFY